MQYAAPILRADNGAMESGTPQRPGEPVPGTVTLVTQTPLEMPLSAAAGQSSLAEHLEERPWLVAVAILGVLGFFLLVRRGDRG